MTDSIKPAASGSDDPWEQLAEDLFGLEYGKEHASLEPSTPQPVPAGAPPVESAPPVREEPPVYAEFVHPRVDTPASPETAPAYAEIPVRPATPSAQDSYWDALANWNWGDSEGSARNKPADSRPGEGSRGSGPRSRDEGRSAPAADRPGPAPVHSRTESRRDAPSQESSDFGLGVDSTSSGRGPARSHEPPKDRLPPPAAVESDDFDDSDDDDDDDSTTAELEEQETAAPGDENAPRKRRRRRRRRGRGRNGNEPAGAASPAGEAPPAKVPGEDWDQPAEAPKAPRSDDRSRRPSGEGRPPAERGDERSRGSRRRRGDRRGAPPQGGEQREPLPGHDDESDSPVDEVTNVGGGGAGIDFASDDEDAGDLSVNFGEVPTWEEAISYLLHPNQVQLDSNGGSGSSSGESRSGEQPRSTRHYGGRR